MSSHVSASTKTRHCVLALGPLSVRNGLTRELQRTARIGKDSKPDAGQRLVFK